MRPRSHTKTVEITALLLLACGSDGSMTEGSPGTDVFDNAAARPATAAGGSGSAEAETERCDGIDNDRNGIVDDVDVQGDGVCDCLRIATIGEIGPWSDGGNVFRAWLDSRSETPAAALGDQVLTEALLEPYQVVVVLYAATQRLDTRGRKLAPHHAFSAEEVAVFERWVHGGGGVMTTIGYTASEAEEVVNVNRLLAPLGLGYSTTDLDVDGYVTDWVQPHPLTNMVSNIFTENGVATEGSKGMTLARDSGGRSVLHAAEPDNGRAIVWGDEWITYDSQWQDVEDQQVERLWLNMLKWLSPEGVCQVELPGPE